MKRVFLFLFCLFTLLARDSHAYIDPGSGSYVLQLIVASFFAVVFTVKMFWRNIKAFFSGADGKKQDNAGTEQS